MSLESVQAFLAARAPEVEIVALRRHSSTANLSADWEIAPGQVAKTLALKVGERHLLLVACGDSRLDNAKAKAALGGKASLLAPEAAAALTGHPPGGVCPFGLRTPMRVYFDVRLQGYALVAPAAGSTHHAILMSPRRMAEVVGGAWVDVCKDVP